MAGSPTIAALFVQRVVVGVGDLAVSNNTSGVLSTYALGSCIGVVAFDPTTRASGILHFMLPDSTISPEKAVAQPAMFADTGFPRFLRSLQGLRASATGTRFYLAGGAGVISGSDAFRIGERNIAAAKQWVQKLGLNVVAADVGGINNRTLHLKIATGELTMKSPVGTRAIDLR
jgi:chemotaxis protein CheD